MYKGKKLFFSVATVLLMSILTIVVPEIGLRIFAPQVTMYPRWQFSKDYGAMLFKNCKMVHERHGKWKFIYTTNQYQYRGNVIPISDDYNKVNVVVLGDSYSFGIGVNDGEEYPAIIQEKLRDRINVVNLGVMGWGLTQEIRRYYEFGKLYKPKYVILQFCGNDPDDNFLNLVTTIDNDKIVFKESNNDINWIKKFMSKSIIQKSQIYNLFRNRIYLFFAERLIKKHDQSLLVQSEKSKKSDFYNKLLTRFADDLKANGVTLIVISVNDELDLYPEIKKRIHQLAGESKLKYFYVLFWLKGLSEYGSPEGHAWGKLAHKIIGERLSEIIQKLDQNVP